MIVVFFFLFLIEGLIGLLESRRGQDAAYIGCMKSGEVVAEEFVSYSTLLNSRVFDNICKLNLFPSTWVFLCSEEGNGMSQNGGNLGMKNRK